MNFRPSGTDSPFCKYSGFADVICLTSLLVLTKYRKNKPPTMSRNRMGSTTATTCPVFIPLSVAYIFIVQIDQQLFRKPKTGFKNEDRRTRALHSVHNNYLNIEI